jgi:hypothetical protein
MAGYRHCAHEISGLGEDPHQPAPMSGRENVLAFAWCGGAIP